jgi:hypothetical protein
MTKSKAVVLLGLLATGCFRIEVYAPHGPPVKLLARDAAVSVTRENRTWYAILGVVPIDNTQPAEFMRREGLREVRVAVTDTVPDMFIGLFYNILVPIFLVNQSYVVEGNRAPGDVPARAASSP